MQADANCRSPYCLMELLLINGICNCETMFSQSTKPVLIRSPAYFSINTIFLLFFHVFNK